jgi:hypothetical protein
LQAIEQWVFTDTNNFSKKIVPNEATKAKKSTRIGLSFCRPTYRLMYDYTYSYAVQRLRLSGKLFNRFV